MNKRSYLLIFTVSILLLAACSSKPTAVPVPDTPEPTPELIELLPTNTPDTEEPEAEDNNFQIEETKTTLLVYEGDVRVSHDDGESWSITDTGLWLEAGDRIQVAEGGIALILFPDSSLIRLEGFTDFELILNEFDFEQGTKRVIGRVWEGAALVTTMPLPSEDSLFQLWAMTTFIDLPYDPAFAVPLDQVDLVNEEDRIAFGALMREEIDGEALLNYGDSVLPDFYALEILDGEILLIKIKPPAGQFSQYDLPFRDNIEDEFTLEGLLDIAAALVEKKHSITSVEDLDVYGYSMIEEGALSDSEVLYSVFDVEELDEFLEEANDTEEKQEFVDYVKTTPSYKRHKFFYKYYKRIPNIFAPEILLMIKEHNLGCDISTGLGCIIPEGCDQETGEGCEFTSGCNIITRDGCAAPKLSCIAYRNCDWADCGVKPAIQHFCKPRVKTYCDPEVAGDCDQYLNTLLPAELVQNPELAGEPLFDPNNPEDTEPFYDEDLWEEYDERDDDEGNDEEIAWCTCTATVPEGYPPPPPNIDMTYRCWCSDPGAR